MPMRIHLITGGARGGKSNYAEERARELSGVDVTYVATGVASDDEMRARIEKHRESRPPEWTTVEAPDGVGQAIRDAVTDTVIVDCLTTLTGNAYGKVFKEGEEAVIQAMIGVAKELVDATARRGTGDVFVVTNEVGFGIHPATSGGRWYRDGLGFANQLIAEAAAEVVLMVCGLPVFAKRLEM